LPGILPVLQDIINHVSFILMPLLLVSWNEENPSNLLSMNSWVAITLSLNRI
jgi:hypothetical protein